MTVKIYAYSYKGFRDSIQGDRLVKLINLMLRSAKCGFLRPTSYQQQILSDKYCYNKNLSCQHTWGRFHI